MASDEFKRVVSVKDSGRKSLSPPASTHRSNIKPAGGVENASEKLRKSSERNSQSTLGRRIQGKYPYSSVGANTEVQDHDGDED